MEGIYDKEYAFVHARSGDYHYFWGIDPSCELYYGDKIKIITVTRKATYRKDINTFLTGTETYCSHRKVEVVSVLRFTKDNFEHNYNKIINATYFEHIVGYELLERGTTLLHDLGFSYVFNKDKRCEPSWVLDGHKVDDIDSFLDSVVLLNESPKIYYYPDLEWYIHQGTNDEFHITTVDYRFHDAAIYNRIIFGADGTPWVTLERTDPAKVKEEFSKAVNSIFKEENNSMFDNIFNKYSFGKVNDNRIAYTTEGLAFRDSAGDYIVYKDGTGINMNQFKIDVPLFKMPVPLKDIQPGDIIVHFAVGNNAYLLVEEVKDNGIVVIDPQDKTRKEIVPEKSSIFGFDFIPKVIAPITADAIKANEENPFGNLLPFLMMSDNSNNNNDMMMFMMMQNGGFEFNPMMLMMMDKSDNNDWVKYLIMSQMINPTTKN